MLLAIDKMQKSASGAAWLFEVFAIAVMNLA